MNIRDTFETQRWKQMGSEKWLVNRQKAGQRRGEGRHSTPAVWILHCSQALRYNSAVPPCQVRRCGPVGPTRLPFSLLPYMGIWPPLCSKGLLCSFRRCSSDPETEKKRDYSCSSTLLSVTPSVSMSTQEVLCRVGKCGHLFSIWENGYISITEVQSVN